MRVVTELDEGFASCDEDGIKLLPEEVRVRFAVVDDERTRAVVDILLVVVLWSVVVLSLCCGG